MNHNTAFSKEFLIHESRIDGVIAKLERLSKLAVKLGLDAYSIEITGEKVQSRDDGSALVDVFKTLTFSGEQPTFAGWRFLAKLEHTPDGNIVRTWNDDLDAKYQSCKPDCDHCQVNRARNTTFVVASEDGKQMQVGSSCVDDFIGGHQDPKTLLAMLNGLGQIQWDNDDPYHDPEDDMYASGDGPRSTLVETKRVLEVACAVIRRDGAYYSYNNPDPNGLTTRDEVAYHVYRHIPNGLITGVDQAEAAAVLEWLKAPAPDSEDFSNYIHNLRVLAKQEAIDGKKHLGLMVSAPVAFHKAMTIRQEQSERADASAHIGTVGDKWQGREVIFDGAPSFDTQWGTSYNVLMRDVETGAALKWKTSSPLAMIKGERYFINATIKGHSEYRDQKQTDLTRVSCPDLAAFDKISNSLRHSNTIEKDIKAIIKKLHNPNIVNRKGLTLLLHAGLYFEDNATPDQAAPLMVKALLDAGAHPLSGDKYEKAIKHALDAAMIIGGGSPLLVSMYLEHLKERGVDLSNVATVLSDSRDDRLTWLHDPELGKQFVELAELHGLPVHADSYKSLNMPVPETALTESLTPPLPHQADAPYEYRGADPNLELDDELELNPNVQAPIAPASEGASLTEQPAPALESEPAPEPEPEPEPEPVSMGAMVKAYVAATSNTVATASLDEPDCHEDAPATKKQLGFRF